MDLVQDNMRRCIQFFAVALFGLMLLNCANAIDTTQAGYSNKFTVVTYDEFTDETLSGADVTIWDDGTIIREGYTDRYGKVVFYMPHGKYGIMAQYGGHDRCGFWDGYFTQYKTSVDVYIGGPCP